MSAVYLTLGGQPVSATNPLPITLINQPLQICTTPAQPPFNAGTESTSGLLAPGFAQWKCNEVSGTIAADSVGVNNATLSKDASFLKTSGRIGGAFNFKESDQYLTFSNNFVKFGGVSGISFWVKTGSGAPFAITTQTPLPQATAGANYSLRFTNSGGIGPYTWTISSGTIPGNVGLNAATGVFSGAPQFGGNYTFSVRVTDSTNAFVTKQFQLYIIPQQLIISTTSPLPQGFVAQSYTAYLNATGGAPPYSWSLLNGTLDSGVQVFTGGTVAGTPQINTNYQFTLRVTDSLSTTSDKAFDWYVAPTPPLVIIGGQLPNALFGQSYSYTFPVTGGSPPYGSFFVSDGALPDGLSLDGSTGNIYGTPSTTGSSSFTINVSDNLGNNASAAVAINVEYPIPQITSTSPIPDGQQGQSYNYQFTATGGSGSYTWFLLNGPIDPGCTFYEPGGNLSGTVQGTGPYTNIGVRLIDSMYGTSVDQNFDWFIIQPQPIKMLPNKEIKQVQQPKMGSSSMFLMGTATNWSTANGWYLQLTTAGLNIGGFNNGTFSVTASGLNDGQWHLIGLQYDGVAPQGLLKVWIDNSYVQGFTISSRPNQNLNTLFLGNPPWSSFVNDLYFDDIRFWSNPITDTVWDLLRNPQPATLPLTNVSVVGETTVNIGQVGGNTISGSELPIQDNPNRFLDVSDISPPNLQMKKEDPPQCTGVACGLPPELGKRPSPNQSFQCLGFKRFKPNY